MHFKGGFWATITGWLTLSPFTGNDEPQIPLFGIDTDVTNIEPLKKFPYPIFAPPSGDPNINFECKYPDMVGWEPCSTPGNRECWLRHRNGSEYNIHTNYENFAPKGVLREYTLNLRDGSWNADGLDFTAAKLFDAFDNNVPPKPKKNPTVSTYPGPWIQACWGDKVRVTVNNYMQWNGTSIHWHGIRQKDKMHMDGVNGVTQCPIAPNETFVYEWDTLQYGSSWYHSHYSVQYADGALGPMTIHGPASASYDEAKEPLLMTDWNHLGGFEILYNIWSGRKRAGYNNTNPQTTILLNGRGDAHKFGFEPTSEGPGPYEYHFDMKDITIPGRAKRYLLRLINTSFDSTFVFSIDNHWLQIVTADFVPIEPYFNTSVLVGIGQRYHVIVEANPTAGPTNPIASDGNYWIRTWVADNCGTAGGLAGYERTGIVRYNPLSTKEPTTEPWNNIALRCSDETYSSLKPKMPWYVGAAANDPQNKPDQRFNVTLSGLKTVPGYPLGFFSLDPSNGQGIVPLQINYSDPSFLHLWEPSEKWNKSWVAVPQDYKDTDWAYLVLKGNGKTTTGAHPIHLHGHDYAILQQEENLEFDLEKFRAGVGLKFNNPPRRDVVLLPKDGFVVIAFKTDNPGLWLMHCHIAYHASFGLGLQINERQGAANDIWPFHDSKAIAAANQTCKEWKDWQGECTNLWPGVNSTGEYPACYTHHYKDAKGMTQVLPFQDDSGI